MYEGGIVGGGRAGGGRWLCVCVWVPVHMCVCVCVCVLMCGGGDRGERENVCVWRVCRGPPQKRPDHLRGLVVGAPTPETTTYIDMTHLAPKSRHSRVHYVYRHDSLPIET